MAVTIKLDRDELVAAADEGKLWFIYEEAGGDRLFYGKPGVLRELSDQAVKQLDSLIARGRLKLVHDMAGVYRIAGS